MNSDLPIIQLNSIDVSISSSGTSILEIEHLALNRSQITGIIGESGSGKSTLLKVLSGSIFYDQAYIVRGKARFHKSKSENALQLDTMNSVGKKQKNLVPVSLVPQEPMASFSMVHSIGKQLNDTQKIIEPNKALDLVGLEPQMLNRYPGELSLGQMQRVAIAAALCTGTELILMDEPGASLDQIRKQNLSILIKELNENQGISFVIVSHQLDFVSEICSTFYKMDMGHLTLLELGDLKPKRPELPDNGSSDTLTSSDLLIQTENLSFKYAGTSDHVLKDISIGLHKGIKYGVMGVSGGGKSTLGRILCGLNFPSGGTIKFNGRTSGEFTRKEWMIQKRKIQYLWQDALMALNPGFTAGKLLRFAYENYKSTESALTMSFFEMVLRNCGIGNELLKLYPVELSGGQRQRINLARAILSMPEIIVADEPFSAIDEKHKPDLYQVFNEVSEKHQIGLILISHDIKDLIACCDKLIVLDKGHIIENGDLKNIVKNSTNSVTKQLIGASYSI